MAGTLSALGADIFPPGLAFHAIICDEAAQAVEPASLVPLHLLAPGGKLVLVGDPKQLPATVISCGAAAGMLSQSLFERCQKVSSRTIALRRTWGAVPAERGLLHLGGAVQGVTRARLRRGPPGPPRHSEVSAALPAPLLGRSRTRCLLRSMQSTRPCPRPHSTGWDPSGDADGAVPHAPRHLGLASQILL